MPPNIQNDSGITSWDVESNLLRPDHFDFTFDSNVEDQIQKANVTDANHNGTARRVTGANQEVNFDFHRVPPSPWPLYSEQTQSSPTALPPNVGGDWRSFFNFTEPNISLANAGGDATSLPAGQEIARPERTVLTSQLSPADSAASKSSQSSTHISATTSVSSSHNANKLGKTHSRAAVMSSRSTYPSTNGRMTPNPKKPHSVAISNSMKKTHSGGRTLDLDDEARRGQYTRGGSLVSSTSGLSRVEIDFRKPETRDNDNTRTQENRGAGRTPGVLRNGQGDDASQFALPPGKGFPIQIGSELFRLSGASIMSDGQYIFAK